MLFIHVIVRILFEYLHEAGIVFLLALFFVSVFLSVSRQDCHTQKAVDEFLLNFCDRSTLECQTIILIFSFIWIGIRIQKFLFGCL